MQELFLFKETLEFEQHRALRPAFRVGFCDLDQLECQLIALLRLLGFGLLLPFANHSIQ